MDKYDFIVQVFRASHALGLLSSCLLADNGGLDADAAVGLGYLCTLVKTDLYKAAEEFGG